MLESLLSAFDQRIEKLESRVKELEQTNTELKKKLDCGEPDFKRVISIQESLIVELEQYSRRTNIKIFGVTESAGRDKEDTLNVVSNIIKDKLELDVGKNIIVAHRIPSRNTAAPRPIIVKFLHPSTQEMVLRSRRKLKGRPISISDDLSFCMQNVLNRAKHHDMVKDAWSCRGKIFYQVKGSEQIRQLKFGEPVRTD